VTRLIPSTPHRPLRQRLEPRLHKKLFRYARCRVTMILYVWRASRESMTFSISLLAENVFTVFPQRCSFHGLWIASEVWTRDNNATTCTTKTDVGRRLFYSPTENERCIKSHVGQRAVPGTPHDNAFHSWFARTVVENGIDRIQRPFYITMYGNGKIPKPKTFVEGGYRMWCRTFHLRVVVTRKKHKK